MFPGLIQTFGAKPVVVSPATAAAAFFHVLALTLALVIALAILLPEQR